MKMKICLELLLSFLLFFLIGPLHASVPDTAWTFTLPENEYVVNASFSSDDSLVFITVYYINAKGYDPDSVYTSVRNSITGQEIRKTVYYKSGFHKYATNFTKPKTDTTYAFLYTKSSVPPYFKVIRFYKKTNLAIDTILVNVDIPEFKNDTNYVSLNKISPDGKRFFLRISFITGYNPDHQAIYEHKLYVWNTENWTIDRSFMYNDIDFGNIATNNKYYTERVDQTKKFFFSEINTDTILYVLQDNDSAEYGYPIFPKTDTTKFLVPYYDKIAHWQKYQVRRQSDFSVIKNIMNDSIYLSSLMFLKESRYVIFYGTEGDNKGKLIVYDLELQSPIYVYPKFYYVGYNGNGATAVSNNSKLIFDGYSRTCRMLNAKYTTTSTSEPGDDNPGLIYPNPASDYIEISLSPLKRGDSGVCPVRIFDLLGVEITTLSNLTPALSKGEGAIRIDVSGLLPGVYFVRVGNEVRKFVKI